MAGRGDDRQLQLSLVDLQEFNSEAILRSFVCEYAEKHGFRAVITHSNDKAIHFACQHHRRSGRKNGSERQPLEQGCPFALAAYHSKSTRSWTLKTKNCVHNHPCGSAQNAAQKRVCADIAALHRAGNKPAFIQQKVVSNHPDMEHVVTRKFVYETLRNLRKRELRTRRAAPPLEDSLLET